jgi:ectoine hydroxylase-related dioxygenase (phytanoyl-CoA dioxygenase family)
MRQPPRDLDEMNAFVDGLGRMSWPLLGLKLLGVRLDDGPARSDISHLAFMRRPLAERQRILARGGWRIHRLDLHCEAAHRLYTNERLRQLASLIFGRFGQPFATIAFLQGSQQLAHQDMAVFHIHPHNHLIGAWIACEDISADSGPLMFYPGSHREPLFGEFTNYPQTNLRTAGDGLTGRYYDQYIVGLTKKYPKKEFIAKRGQVLLWHGMLMHGGSPVRDPALTRRSFVVHYTVPEFNWERQVLGPFNW